MPEKNNNRNPSESYDCPSEKPNCWGKIVEIVNS